MAVDMYEASDKGNKRTLFETFEYLITAAQAEDWVSPEERSLNSEERSYLDLLIELVGTELNVADCMFRLGIRLIFEGEPSEDSELPIPKALELIRAAGEQQHPQALAWLGENGENDEGESSNPNKCT
jgi:hypothetical protein